VEGVTVVIHITSQATHISFRTLKLRECGRAGGTNKHRFNHYEFRLQRFQEAMTWWLGIVSSTADVTCEMLKLEAEHAVAGRS
jgi:hypothetical protein